MQKLVESVTCPKCASKLRPTFQICQQEHLVCHNCKQHLDAATGSVVSGDCTGKLFTVSVLNKMFQDIFDNCQYGCGYRADLLELELHEKSCSRNHPISSWLGAMLLLLECIICTEVMETPIRICESGHSLCGKCANKIIECPTCRQNITQARNYTLEQVSDNIKSRKIKCGGLNNLSSLSQQIDRYDLQNTLCPMKNNLLWCDWNGRYNDLLNHCKEEHYQDVKQIEFVITSPSTVRMFSAADNVFLLTSPNDGVDCYYSVHHLTDRSATDFYFDLKFSNSATGDSVEFSRRCVASTALQTRDKKYCVNIGNVCKIPCKWYSDVIMHGGKRTWTLNIYRKKPSGYKTP